MGLSVHPHTVTRFLGKWLLSSWYFGQVCRCSQAGRGSSRSRPVAISSVRKWSTVENRIPLIPRARAASMLDAFVVDEECFFGPRAEFFKRMVIDGGIGLGHACAGNSRRSTSKRRRASRIRAAMFSSTESPMLERIAVSRPCCLSLLLPGKHGRILGGPHAGVPEVQLVDGRRLEIEPRVADDLLPECEPGELALVVGVAVGPVERFESIAGRPVMRSMASCASGVRLSGENHSIVEDDSAQSQCSSLNAPCMVERALLLL